MSFEKDIVELETLVEKLEKSETGLEEGISLYEKGIVLTKNCLDYLVGCKNKITLVKQEMDKLIEKPFDGEL